MKNLKMICFTGMPLLFMTSCFNTVDKKLILGEWVGVEWLIDGQPSSYNADATFFNFQNNGKYSYTYAGTVETGTYFISNNELLTTPEGGIQMMVKIQALTPETLIFEMNRGGTSEQLTLTRIVKSEQ